MVCLSMKKPKTSKLLVFNVIFLFVLSSCTMKYNRIFKNPDSEGKTGIVSKYNDDNSVFKMDSSFRYQVIQTVQSDTINFNIELLVIPGNYNYGTKVKYKYQYDLDQLNEKQKSTLIDSLNGYGWEITSVNEDIESIWLHPPRSKTLFDLEIAPFPSINLSETADSIWSTVLSVGPGWGEYSWSNFNKYYRTKQITYSIDSSSKIIEVESYSERKDSVLCRAYFTYDTKKGFTSMDYKFTNGNRIKLTLVD